MEVVTKAHNQQQEAASYTLQSCRAAWQSVKEDIQSTRDQQIETLHSRFAFGKSVHNAVKSGATQSDIADECATTSTKVSDHKLFAEWCAREYPSYDPPVAGYVAKCLDMDRSLAWRKALSVMRSNTEDDTADDSTAEQYIEDVEEAIRVLEERAEEAAEHYEDAGPRLSDDMRQQMESMLLAADQVLDDHEDLPDAVDERLEWESLRRFAERGACRKCGVNDNTTTAHHIERRGTGIKADDTYITVLCDPCHTELHNMPEAQFWGDRNPYKDALDIVTKAIKIAKSNE